MTFVTFVMSHGTCWHEHHRHPIWQRPIHFNGVAQPITNQNTLRNKRPKKKIFHWKSWYWILFQVKCDPVSHFTAILFCIAVEKRKNAFGDFCLQYHKWQLKSPFSSFKNTSMLCAYFTHTKWQRKEFFKDQETLARSEHVALRTLRQFVATAGKKDTFLLTQW